MSKITSFFTILMKKYTPDPFVFAIGLTILTLILAILVEGKSFISITQAWGNGFWDLLAFTTQMAVILAMGYVLASAPIVDRILSKIVSKVHKPRMAIMVATLVGGIGCYLNWGFGLVIGGIVAKKLATQVKGVHYPLIIAAAYSGLTMYGFGISSSIPLIISSPEHPLEGQMGIIPLSDTIFSLPMIITALVTIITLPFINSLLHPREKDEIIEFDSSLEKVKTQTAATVESVLETNTIANKLNNSRLLVMAIGLMSIIYIVSYFLDGGFLNINIINFIILFLGIILLGSPSKYIAKLTEGIKTISGIILQYPFYAGIMAIMAASGLVTTISTVFINIADSETLPFWGLISSFVINFFAPSAGGHWVVQGPFMIDAANDLSASLSKTSMSVMLGNSWNDLIQPFWLLPALALSGLKLKDIMGYAVISMIWVGVIYISAVLIWGYLG
ncbi:short-chain fatty acid transporter [Peribacillus sp. NPDC097264]|uniref:short-chain fatty acid transporter n=1 Tax=Peribacillus sp. NPDC097264 TaxID=3390616 RepID=UPI003D0077C8